ncbi:MAG: hypothetical protein NTZ12_07100, partial [Candidatus Aminicenantes bacterium]|nr:hypothetical protein [Candidatus Aminicenantes bacterium]
TIINRTLQNLTCFIILVLLFFYVFKSDPFNAESPDLQIKPSGKFLKIPPAQHQPYELERKKSHRPSNEKGD